MVGLYALGTGGAFGFAWLFKHTLVKGEPALMIMELPPYRLPRLGEVARHMLERGWMFLRRAGTTILGISIVLWFLAAYPKINDTSADAAAAEVTGGEVTGAEVTSNKWQVPSNAGAATASTTTPATASAPDGEVAGNKYQVTGAAGTAAAIPATVSIENQKSKIENSAASPAGQQLAQSFAGMAGRAIEPVIKPLGFDWRVGIGIIGSLAAREVFISTMGTVFSIENAGEEPESLRDAFAKATWPDGRPLFTPLVCVTLLIFYVFAMQCLATLAVVRRETNSLRWPAFQLAYMTGAAWLVCLVVHQGGRLLGF
jgi:ferrous iron transport protein B